ncbi:MAG: hypothetical protein EOM83_09045 [Clostridia bacterium]|nr:hypothetical protein [Clostridia bacterium]
MIRDFSKTAEQLKEIAKVINQFQSEAVQLKLIELLFASNSMEPAEAPVKERKTRVEKAAAVATEAQPAAETETPVVVKRRPGRPPKVKTEAPARKPRKRSADRPGPSLILKQLVDNNFFADKRTIGDVVDYCQKIYNYDYKSTDLSGTLAKLAKDGFLLREKNPESNQFEYSKA